MFILFVNFFYFSPTYIIPARNFLLILETLNFKVSKDRFAERTVAVLIFLHCNIWLNDLPVPTNSVQLSERQIVEWSSSLLVGKRN